MVVTHPAVYSVLVYCTSYTYMMPNKVGIKGTCGDHKNIGTKGTKVLTLGAVAMYSPIFHGLST